MGFPIKRLMLPIITPRLLRKLLSVEEKMKLSHDKYYVLNNGRLMRESDICTSGRITVILRLLGGKGGFGTKLNAVDEKTRKDVVDKSFSGRRLRNMRKEEKKVKSKWIHEHMKSQTMYKVADESVLGMSEDCDKMAKERPEDKELRTWLRNMEQDMCKYKTEPPHKTEFLVPPSYMIHRRAYTTQKRLGTEAKELEKASEKWAKLGFKDEIRDSYTPISEDFKVADRFMREISGKRKWEENDVPNKRTMLHSKNYVDEFYKFADEEDETSTEPEIERINLDQQLLIQMIEESKHSSDNVGEVSENIERSSDNVGEDSENIEHSSDNVREVSENIEYSSDNVEEVSENIEYPSDNVGEVSENIEKTESKPLSEIIKMAFYVEGKK